MFLATFHDFYMFTVDDRTHVTQITLSKSHWFNFTVNYAARAPVLQNTSFDDPESMILLWKFCGIFIGCT